MKTICWTKDVCQNKLIIGYQGGPLYEIDSHKLLMAIWEHRVEDTPEGILKYAIKESQYVSFEEIKPATPLLR